jgi:hypothetical protein
MKRQRNGRNLKAVVRGVAVSKLTQGDRFLWRDTLYTWLKPDHSIASRKWIIARKHGPDSIRLGMRGYGYNGDSIVAFPWRTRVEFVPPNTPGQGRPEKDGAS